MLLPIPTYMPLEDSEIPPRWYENIPPSLANFANHILEQIKNASWSFCQLIISLCLTVIVTISIIILAIYLAPHVKKLLIMIFWVLVYSLNSAASSIVKTYSRRDPRRVQDPGRPPQGATRGHANPGYGTLHTSNPANPPASFRVPEQQLREQQKKLDELALERKCLAWIDEVELLVKKDDINHWPSLPDLPCNSNCRLKDQREVCQHKVENLFQIAYTDTNLREQALRRARKSLHPNNPKLCRASEGIKMAAATMSQCVNAMITSLDE